MLQRLTRLSLSRRTVCCRLSVASVDPSAFSNVFRFVRAALGVKLQTYKSLELKRDENEKFGLGSPQYVSVMKQLARLQGAVDLLQQIESAEEEISDLKKMIKEQTMDVEFVSMAKQEIKDLTEKVSKLEESALPMLVPETEEDIRNAILEVRAGIGGEEAAMFAGDLFLMYENFARLQGWRFEKLTQQYADYGGLKEAIAMISGEGVFGKLKYETGVHRVQRIPKTVAVKKMHTSTATVAVLPEAESVELNINQADLRIDVYRAGGAGGQHVNKTESAVRITHIPTGTVVAIQDERSQHQNKSKAMKILQTKLYQLEKEKLDKERSSMRKEQVGSSERFDRIRTYNFQQNRITDHRVQESLFDADAMIRGELLEQFIDMLERESLMRSLQEIGSMVSQENNDNPAISKM